MKARKSAIARWLLMWLVTLILVGCSQDSLTGLRQGVATPVSGPAESPSQVAPSPSTPGAVVEASTRTPQPRATRPAPTDTPQSPLDNGDGEEAVLVGAGDIGDCDGDGDERTAALLDDIEGTVFTLGDNVYDRGTAREFRECYEPSWGRHKERTRPTPGNHDYRTDDAGPYYDYFGDAAGEKGKGYYSYDLGSWHIVVLNSNCKHVGGCEEDSEQGRWLEDD
ncbi:MAG TPA: metallophosphoesterase, partial [Chloroflexia bacterium]|nr:metallophosphoesterase [Chloroflexia bacterium]